MKLYCLFLLLVLFYGCSKSSDLSVGNLTVPNQTQTNLISCEDNNPCTDNYFNLETGQCDSRRLNHCCGDGFCDADERCDLSNYQTKCSQDCPRKCPAHIIINNFSCIGDCNEVNNIYEIAGYAKLKVNLKNIGEMPLYSLSSRFVCKNLMVDEVYSSSIKILVDGVRVREYFDSYKDSITLTGEDYGFSSMNYTLEFAGITEAEKNVTCLVYFSAPGFYNTINLNLNIKKQ